MQKQTLYLFYIYIYKKKSYLQITLGRILKAIIAFKGLMIEWVVVKDRSESNDLWTESRYKVFRKVTENCHAAMCHFHSPMMPDLAVRSFMVSNIFFYEGDLIYYKN